MIRTILFDLDDTLYPPDSGIMEQIRTLILRYIELELELPTNEADELRHRYLLEYGTTLRGLQSNHQIDADAYLRFVHDFSPRDYLETNPTLDKALSGINLEKIVFTNASREHAERVLDALGVRRHFSRIIDVRDMAFESKPQPQAYQRVCELLQTLPERCALVEDSVRNLEPAKELGMTTVLVWDGKRAARSLGSSPHSQAVDHLLPCIEEIGSLMARLCQA
jgi:putative hydrolase of the HAD superfamily